MSGPPRRALLVPVLAELGARTGCVLTRPPGRDAWGVEGTVLRGGRVLLRARADGIGDAARLEEGVGELAGWLAQPGDLLVARHLPDDPSGELEGHLLYQAAACRCGVLTGFVPVRAAGYRFSPIIHLGHYALDDARFATWACFANLPCADPAGAAPPNDLAVEVIEDDGARAGATRLAVPQASTTLVPYDRLLRDAGVAPAARHRSFVFRGGSSQFAVFTILVNRASGAFTIEHSLPPVYYATGIATPEGRLRFNATAFTGAP